MAAAWAGIAAIGRPGESQPGAGPVLERKSLADRVQSLDRVAEEKSPWGSIRWVMNSKLDPESGITMGIVELYAGKSNPLHLHSNSEEVIYMLSGVGEHRVGKETVILRAGDTLRVPAGTPHQAKAIGTEPMRSVVVYNTGNRQFSPVEEGAVK
jgi:quercetin dioxygenase-like cupin family protein